VRRISGGKRCFGFGRELDVRLLVATGRRIIPYDMFYVRGLALFASGYTQPRTNLVSESDPAGTDRWVREEESLRPFLRCGDDNRQHRISSLNT